MNFKAVPGQEICIRICVTPQIGSGDGDSSEGTPSKRASRSQRASRSRSKSSKRSSSRSTSRSVRKMKVRGTSKKRSASRKKSAGRKRSAGRSKSRSGPRTKLGARSKIKMAKLARSSPKIRSSSISKSRMSEVMCELPAYHSTPIVKQARFQKKTKERQQTPYTAQDPSSSMMLVCTPYDTYKPMVPSAIKQEHLTMMGSKREEMQMPNECTPKTSTGAKRKSIVRQNPVCQ
jgi:hypothetical protein